MRNPNYEGITIPPVPTPDTPIKTPDLKAMKKPGGYALSQTKEVIARTLNLTVVTPPKGIEADLAVPVYALAKERAQSPDDVAAEIASQPIPEVTATATRGFVNFHLNRSSFAQRVLDEVEQLGPKYGEQNIGEGRSVVIDYSSPNIAKFMSVAHLRSTAIGASLARVYEATGHTVIADNHLGDWGTQFGMLGRAYELWSQEVPDLAEGGDKVKGLYQLYVKMHDEVEKEKDEQIRAGVPKNRAESALEKEGKAWFLKLEQGDPKAQELLEWSTQLSKDEFSRIYDLLGVKFNYELGESKYVSMLPDVLAKFKQTGVARVATAEDRNYDGAPLKDSLIVDMDDKKLDKLVIQKSDGASIYSTRDLATLVARNEWFDPAKIVYVVGNEQAGYFKQVFEAHNRLAGDKGAETVHVGFGRMNLPEGKMSTRAGRVVFLETVLNEAIRKASERIDQSPHDFDDEQKARLARQIGVGATIFFDLGQGRERNIKFDMDKALALEGQSAPYIQYTHARAEAIVTKAGEPQDPSVAITTDSEFALVKELARYPESIADALSDNEPSRISERVARIAEAYNQFYKNDRVIGIEEPTFSTRLRLTQAAKQVIRNGLGILGIEAPARM